MQRLTVVGVVGLLVLAGCGTGSVYPFYRSQDILPDSSLVGSWRDSSTSEGARFFVAGDHYDILYTDKDGRTGHLEGYVFRLAGRVALDVTVGDLPDSVRRLQSDAYWFLQTPIHILLWFHAEPNRLTFVGFDADTLDAYVRSHPGELEYIDPGEGGVTLTSPTLALQRFVAVYQGRPHVFSDSAVWWRRAAPN